MADEAILKVILEGTGGTGGGGTGPGGGGGSGGGGAGPPGTRPLSEPYIPGLAAQGLEREDTRNQVKRLMDEMRSPLLAPFDVEKEAYKARELARRHHELQEAAFDPEEEAKAQLQAQERKYAVEAAGSKMPGWREPAPPPTPPEEAQLQLHKVRESNKVQEEYWKLLSDPSVALELATASTHQKLQQERQLRLAQDVYLKETSEPALAQEIAIASAQKRAHGEKQLREAQDEYWNIVSDPDVAQERAAHAARARYEKQKEAAAAEEEFNKRYKIDVVYDPQIEARERREREIRQEREKRAYEEMYGKGEEKGGPGWLDTAKSMRGMLGGTLGTLVGAGLDVAAALGNKEEDKAPGVSDEEITRQEDADRGVKVAKNVKDAGGKPVDTAVATKVAGGAEAAAAGGMAAAVPIIGAAIAVAEEVKKMAHAAVDAGKAFGQFTANLLSPDANPANYVKSFGEAVTTAGSSLEKISPVAGLIVQGFGAAVEVTAAFMRNLDGLADRYKKYSPALAVASAQAEVTQIMGDLRRAQEAGPKLAQYVQARTEMQQKFEDAKIRFMGEVLPMVMVMMNKAEALLPLVELMVRSIMPIMELTFPDLADEVRQIRRQMDQYDTSKAGADMTAIIMENVRGRAMHEAGMLPAHVGDQRIGGGPPRI